VHLTLEKGILPTIIWHLPLSARFRAGGLLDGFFRTARDFYPTFFTIYQTAIFFGRTSITFFRLPGGNSGSSSAYYGLCLTEVLCFLTILSQSLSMARHVPANRQAAEPDMVVRFSPIIIGIVMFCMGLCGGLGMSNTYWRVSKKALPQGVWRVLEKALSKKPLVARQEGLMTPTSPDGEEESYFFQRDRPRPRLRNAFSSGPKDLGLTLGRNSMPLLPGAEGSKGPGERKWSRKEETAVREFLISTIALPDTVAIMLASIVSLWLQPQLCQMQVAGGRELCVGGAV
jgi:hypothetical protein